MNDFVPCKLFFFCAIIYTELESFAPHIEIYSDYQIFAYFYKYAFYYNPVKLKLEILC